jgi:ABC-2 type transport system ATP-binding protein
VDSDRDAPAEARQGPGGRTATARSATTRRTSAAAPRKSTPPAEPSDPVDPVADPVVESPDPGAEPTAAAAETPAKPARRPKAAAKSATSTAVAKAPARKPAAAKTTRAPRASVARPANAVPALSVTGLLKRFGGVTAVDHVDMEIPAGTFYGFVGPNGAGKTTTLAMVTGLLRPDAGVVTLHGVDVWKNPVVAKRSLGVLPDQLRLFDRLTGAEFLHHAGALRGLDRDTIAHRVDDLSAAFGLKHSLDRFVSDYSAGMVKKIAIAAAMIHSPRLLVLDEPFESVDPVSANVVIGILKKYAAHGGTVLLSSHSMTLIERTCDAVAIIADGRMLAAGPLDEVLAGESLETRFVELAGGATAVEGMEWLQSYSD